MSTLRNPSLAALLSIVSLIVLFETCTESSNPTGSRGSSSLTVRPESLSVGIMGLAMSSISGGTKPYSVQPGYDTTKIAAAVSDSTLFVLGRAQGRASVVVKDSPGTSTGTVHILVDTSSSPPGPVLGFSPSSATVSTGGQVTVSILGGILPYRITIPPNASVAGASISGSNLIVTGVGVGTTSVAVKDASTSSGTLSITVASGGCSLDLAGTWIGTFTLTSSGQSFNASASISGTGSSISGTLTDLTHNITWTLSSVTCSGNSFHAVFVEGLVANGTLSGNTMTGTWSLGMDNGTFSLGRSGGGGLNSGSVSFNSNKGNFSASGDYDSLFVTNVGAFNYYEDGHYYLVILALHTPNLSTYEYASLVFSNSSPIGAGTYVFSYPKYFAFTFGPPKSVYDTSTSVYIVTNTTALISSFTSTTAQGTFSGKGYNSNNSSDSITVTDGIFSVNYVNKKPWGKSLSAALGKHAGRMVREMIRSRKEQEGRGERLLR